MSGDPFDREDLQGMSFKRQRLYSLGRATASLTAPNPFEQEFQKRRQLMASRSASFPDSRDMFTVRQGRLPEAPARGMQALLRGALWSCSRTPNLLPPESYLGLIPKGRMYRACGAAGNGAARCSARRAGGQGARGD